MNYVPALHSVPAAPQAGSPSTAEMLRPSQVLGVTPPAEYEPFPCTATGEDGLPALEAYYDRARGHFLTRNSGGRWISLNESQFKRLLRSKGYSAQLSNDELKEGKTASEMDEVLIHYQDTRDVSYAGPLAGRSTGFYKENGERILVTDSPELITPAPAAAAGEKHWPLMHHFLRGLVASPEEAQAIMQWTSLLGWLAAAVQSLYSTDHQPGQALVLAGPPGCGKSVLQNHVITPLLGGRAAKCAPYLQGRTDFNGELFGAEHLMLEDEHSDTRIASRLALASHIKQICVNTVQPCQAKHRPAMNLTPFWRLSISLNDEPERLLIIPPLGLTDIAEKLIILRCRAFTWPMPVATPKQWKEFTAALRAELPAFLAFLLSHAPPPDRRHERYGIKSWQHPDLARELDEMAPEAHLALLIQRWLGSRTEWNGTADELRMALLNDDDTAHDARDLLHWPNACGTYLARLEGKRHLPFRLEQRRIYNTRHWTLTVPKC